ncbi:MAG: FAD-binding oxidoreductase, partial [Candidatus Paceibacterota bacterium]
MSFPASVLADLTSSLEGDVVAGDHVLDQYSTDASLFVVKPQLVVYPKGAEDIKKVVHIVNQYKKEYPDLSITVRAAGTCMSGGPLNKSIILDVTKYMQGGTKIEGHLADTLPGTFYRDFERATLKTDQILASFTASRDLNTIGGMVGNNSGGEKNLRFGKTEKYLKESHIILADGNEYEVKPLTKNELDEVMARDDFWGRLHTSLFNLIEANL